MSIEVLQALKLVLNMRASHPYALPNFSSLFIALLTLILIMGCATIPVTREIKQVQEIASLHPQERFIKTHMKDGTVFILYDWQYKQTDSLLRGYGKLLGINRNTIESRHRQLQGDLNQPFTIYLDQIALFETNQVGESLGAGLGVITGIAGIMSIICITNPKSCFGSCPTFYAFNGDSMTIQAEGFSTSIAPSLEKNDIDMLYTARPSPRFKLEVTNEALETHSIRYARILAFEKREGERVFATPDDVFYKCPTIRMPVSCVSDNDDCTELTSTADHKEYFSLSDSANLNSKEEIYLTFSSDEHLQQGLVIGKRQTLLTTFLMYQGLAYMGNSVTYWLAELERGKALPKNNVFNILGGIEVFRKDQTGQWKLEGELHETGPIATDYNVIPLSVQGPGTIELKLRMNQGLWRIDYLGLAALGEIVHPVIIHPSAVDRISGQETDPYSKLKDEDEYLVTFPGDAYAIYYDLPFVNAELFLDSRGYYLEWIREAWIEEQSFKKLNQFLNKPEKYLVQIADEYKQLEPTMEETFWNSRYEKH